MSITTVSKIAATTPKEGITVILAVIRTQIMAVELIMTMTPINTKKQKVRHSYYKDLVTHNNVCGSVL